MLLAADLGNAKVMSAKQNPRIFAEEIIDDDTEDDNDENNENETKKSSFKHSHDFGIALITLALPRSAARSNEGSSVNILYTIACLCNFKINMC